MQTALIRVAQRFSATNDPYRCAFRAVINEVADRRRRRNRRPEVLGPDIDYERGDHTQTVVNRHALIAALATLPILAQEVLVLRYLEGFTESEIANLLGRPLGTIKSAAKRGTQSLRRQLSNRPIV